MARQKYKYNPETLSYIKVEHSIWDKIIRGTIILSLFFISSVLLSFVVSYVYDSPRERAERQEYKRMKAQYQVLDKKFEAAENLLYDIQQRDNNIYRTIFGVDPIPQSIREAGFGGTNKYKELEGMKNSELIINTTQRLDKLMVKLNVQSNSYEEIDRLAQKKEEMLDCIPAIQPISNKDLTRACSGWGYRIHPVYKIRKFHYGQDFTAPTGTEIYATGAGVVELLDSSSRGYGMKIVINHGFGYKTLYGHCSAFSVKIGQKVKRGDLIGLVGSTGLSTAPHVHYEVHKNGKRVNPINYYFNDLTPEEYDRMIEISANSGKTFD
ncbi:MAG: M23 family metallopeptidase [Bacteroidales bacterium]|nr:M23 family metallopeptidase [Bacteroidales bacterium]